MSRADPRMNAAERVQQQIDILRHVLRFPGSSADAIFALCDGAGESFRALDRRLRDWRAEGLLERSPGSGNRGHFTLTAQGVRWLERMAALERPDAAAAQRLGRVPAERVPPRRPDVMHSVYRPPAPIALRAGALDFRSYRSVGHGC